MSTRSRVERALHGPSLTEVTVGAVMSLVLGALLGVLYLISVPVATVREMPAEPVAGQVYYIEGSRASGVRGTMMNKLKLFTGGGDYDIRLNEAELNAWIGQSVAKPTGEDDDAMVKPESINFRIADGRLQIAAPSTLDLLGIYSQKLILQARGTFAKSGDRFVYNADELMIGSLAVSRFPGMTGLILPRMLKLDDVPEDLIAAWGRLDSVRVEDDTLVLSLP